MNASTQYSDLKGTVAVELFGANETTSLDGLEVYAASKGIDTKLYEPIGIHIQRAQNGAWVFHIHCASRDEVLPQSGKIPVVAFRVSDTWESFDENALGRFDMLLSQGEADIEVVESRELLES